MRTGVGPGTALPMPHLQLHKLQHRLLAHIHCLAGHTLHACTWRTHTHAQHARTLARAHTRTARTHPRTHTTHAHTHAHTHLLGVCAYGRRLTKVRGMHAPRAEGGNHHLSTPGGRARQCLTFV